MSVKIPSSFGFDVDLSGGIDVTLPTTYRIELPTDYAVRVKELAPIEIMPIDLSLRVKEIPSIRLHLPVNYKVGLSLLGREVACVHLCGTGQLITEPFSPYPCEPPFARVG